jgi:DNA-binding NarL/FixJ family response regulator
MLMLEDDVLMWRAVQRIVGRAGDVILAASCAAADAALASGPWSGLVVDVSLPDGSGLEWLSTARRNGCKTPALVLTNNLDRALVNEVFDLRAFYVCKPAPAKSLREFVESLTVPDRSNETFGLLSASAMRVLDLADFSPSELDVIAGALSGISSKEFIDLHKITINTYKSRVRKVLKKTGASSIGEIRDRVLRDLSRSVSWTAAITPQG